MKCFHLKQTLVIVVVCGALFTYLVLAANYAPVMFMSFSKKLHPLDLPNRPVFEADVEDSVSIIDNQFDNKSDNQNDGQILQIQEDSEEERPPKVVILWTTWRSGSTFLGQFLSSAVEDTFYSIEPLHYWKVNILHENNTRTSRARDFLRSLLHCQIPFENQPQIDYLSKQAFYMKWNSYLSSRCKVKRSCARRKFINKICQQANIHVAKVLRLSLKYAYSLLEDDKLDLKIVYVARDPRAVLLSRIRVGWCVSDTCRKPEAVCDLLEDDLAHIKPLTDMFPDKFQFMQFEKMSLDPENTLRNLMSFLELPVSDELLEMLHPSSTNPDSLYSTQKNPKAQSERWRKKADYETVRHIQDACVKPLIKLGLPLFLSNEEMKNLSNPLVTKAPND